MSEAALLLAAALAILCVVFVARPYLREPASTDDRLDEVGDLERRQAELAEERDRALAALKELEHDHRAGAVGDDDYRALVGPLRRRAAEALRALEPRAEGLRTARRGDRAGMSTTGEATPPTPAPVPEPYPPPDEGTPPTPAPVPEPGPPPDEGDLPGPPPDEGDRPHQI